MVSKAIKDKACAVVKAGILIITTDNKITSTRTILFLCHGGTLRISHWRESTVSAPTKSVEKSFLGFGFKVSIRDTPQGRSSRMHRFILPMWFTSLLLVAYPIVALVREIRRRRRRRRGFCRKCGYNLTGLSEPRCPECGTPFGGGSTEELNESSPSQAKTSWSTLRDRFTPTACQLCDPTYASS